MKQLYYGNDFENGYKILACSDGIPSDVREIMTECAIGGGSEEYGLVMLSDAAILYADRKAPPRAHLGEQRPTYFSHQYYISGWEYLVFVNNMARVLNEAEFETGYSDSYNIEEKKLSGGESDEQPRSAMGSAAECALQNGYKIIIYSSGMNGKLAKEMMTRIAGELSWELRQRASFVFSENARDVRIKRAAVIFCAGGAADSIKGRLDRGCIYYDADKMTLAYSWDITPPEASPKPEKEVADDLGFNLDEKQPAAAKREMPNAPKTNPSSKSSAPRSAPKQSGGSKTPQPRWWLLWGLIGIVGILAGFVSGVVLSGFAGLPGLLCACIGGVSLGLALGTALSDDDAK